MTLHSLIVVVVVVYLHENDQFNKKYEYNIKNIQCHLPYTILNLHHANKALTELIV